MIKQELYTNNHFDLVYKLLKDNYTSNRKNGIEASLFNYLVNIDYDHNYSKIFYGEVTGFVFVSLITKELFISVNDDLVDNELIDEMIKYAITVKNEKDVFINIFSKQEKLKQRLLKFNLTKTESWKFYSLGENIPSYEVPSGFIISKKIDNKKLKDLIYQGFDEVLISDIDKFNNLLQSKYRTDLDVLVTTIDGTYVGFGGVWLEDTHAQLEPLCVLPKYRNMGIGKAIVSVVTKRIKELGITELTGGVNEFYSKIGFVSFFRQEVYE